MRRPEGYTSYQDHKGMCWWEEDRHHLKTSVLVLFCMPGLLIGETIRVPGLLTEIGMVRPHNDRGQVVVSNDQKLGWCNYYGEWQVQTGIQEELTHRVMGMVSTKQMDKTKCTIQLVPSEEIKDDLIRRPRTVLPTKPHDLLPSFQNWTSVLDPEGAAPCNSRPNVHGKAFSLMGPMAIYRYICTGERELPKYFRDYWISL